MSNRPAELHVFDDLAPAGFYIALRVGFAYPMLERNALPEGWVAHYTARGLMLKDPVMHWVYANTGAARWSEIALPDPGDVLGDARRFGLRFGVAVSHLDAGDGGQRSFGTFARSEREFTADEISRLSGALAQLHRAHTPPRSLTRAELEALRMVKDGLLMKEIANLLGVSEGAVKQRLKNAKAKLNAKTGTHAAALATEFGLI